MGERGKKAWGLDLQGIELEEIRGEMGVDGMFLLLD
jgi:hypothetical protein